MADVLKYFQGLLKAKGVEISEKQTKMVEEFAADEDTVFSINQIKESQKILIQRFMVKLKIFDIINHYVQIPNATVGKPYVAYLDFQKLGWTDIVYSEFEGIEKYKLVYNMESGALTGIPEESGDFKLKFKFRVDGEDADAPLNEKIISFIINADPKSLWKNIPSDEGKDEAWKQTNFWKPDQQSDFQALGSKHIVVSSKRGRSHANVGSFREDDYAFKHFDQNGWSIVAVSDGAGSAKCSRMGSKLACETVVNYFETNLSPEVVAEADALFLQHHRESAQAAPADENGESTGNKISKFIYNHLGNAARSAHLKLETFADATDIPLRDLHATLIFALYKKYDFGYVVLSFGVGDCPIGLIYNQENELKLMNWLDVGEFGGGTRFITMPEIFSSDKFSTRFGFKMIPDFSYLMLMTDGIYDAKFVVEANLEKVEKWKEFLADLKGNNDDHAAVNFDPANSEMAQQLSTWMEFWSPGNHDDRTLAIVF